MLGRDAENRRPQGRPDGTATGFVEHVSHRGRTAQQGHKVCKLHTLPACDKPIDEAVGKVAGFSLHAGVAARFVTRTIAPSADSFTYQIAEEYYPAFVSNLAERHCPGMSSGNTRSASNGPKAHECSRIPEL